LFDAGGRKEIAMIRTIQIGSCVSVQGLLVKLLDNGKMIVRVGERLFEGVPVGQSVPLPVRTHDDASRRRPVLQDV
jgi:hypothetical protein